MNNKTTHLQIRVTPKQKVLLRKLAKDSKMDMSEWVLTKIFPPQKEKWISLLKQLAHSKEPKFVLAEINDFLTELTPNEFHEILAKHAPFGLDSYWANYIAAMVECAAHQKELDPPQWVLEIHPLQEPVFGTELKSLRLYLLSHSPPSFRNRNIFIDSTLGDRI